MALENALTLGLAHYRSSDEIARTCLASLRYLRGCTRGQDLGRLASRQCDLIADMHGVTGCGVDDPNAAICRPIDLSIMMPNNEGASFIFPSQAPIGVEMQTPQEKRLQ
jgi:hypothetical protein